jgi:TorA maturation chaperone TorD
LSAPSLSLLSRLWLAEPDAEMLALAREAGFPAGDPAELSAAWADLFLLSVYPYATAFTDISAELNGPAAAAASRRYEAAGYRPADISAVGAPDHAGLCLGFLAHLAGIGREDPGFLAWTLDWLPVCAIAVERQPTAPPFYRGMAAATREALLSSAPASAFSSAAPEDLAAASDADCDGEEENDLSRVVRFLLAPAASGFILSRSRLGALALEAGLRLPFGPRFEVARSLFEAAGECGRVEEILAALLREADAWDAAYAALARDHRAWETRARVWQDRLRATRRRLAEMRRLLETPLELEYEEQKES